MEKITEQSQLDAAVEKHEQVLLFKNSTTCPVSANAFDELNAFAEEHRNEIPIYYLNVQEARPLSDYVAQAWQIKHESPQALLLTSSNVEWSTSHNMITNQALKEACL